MAGSLYEVHVMNRPLLPFIFHLDTVCGHPPVALNWHKNIELLFVTEGRGEILCGGVPFSLEAGDLFIINSDVLHATGSAEMLRYYCLILDSGFCADNGVFVEHLHFQEHIRDEDLARAFRRIAAAWEQNRQEETTVSVLEIRLAVLQLLTLLCSRYITGASSGSDTPSGWRVKAAMTYLRTHYAEPLTLDGLARQVGISKYHLSREFKAVTGSTVFELLNRTRCAEARRLMESGMSVSAAAVSCGYDNLSYFTRAFKKRFGCLPSDCLRK